MIWYNGSQVDSLLRKWAAATTTTDSARWHNLIHDKVQSNQHFFSITRKDPSEVQSEDVMMWIGRLHDDGLAPETLRRKVSYLRSFFDWLIEDQQQAVENPVKDVVISRPQVMAEPEAIHYADLIQVLRVVIERRNQGDVAAQRDLLFLLLAFITDLKRNEILRIQRQHLQITGYELYIYSIAQSGDLLKTKNPVIRDLTRTYLASMPDPSPYAPLWTRHDRAGKPGKPLTSQGIGASLRRYTRQAGLENASLESLRVAFKRKMHDIEYDEHRTLSVDDQLVVLFGDLRVEEQSE